MGWDGMVWSHKITLDKGPKIAYLILKNPPGRPVVRNQLRETSYDVN